MTNDPLSEFLAARRRNFQRLENIGHRTNGWLTHLDLQNVDWSTIAHFEGLNVERQQAIEELQEAEQRFAAFLMTRIEQPKP
jgi:hypothetical protein